MASIRKRLSEIRDAGDIEGLAEALVDISELTPLFSQSASLVHDWIVESRELAATCILDRGLEVRQALRHAEVLLSLGQPIPSYAMARRAEALAKQYAELGLQDRATAAASRALVRLGRHDDALTLLTRIAERKVHPSLDDAVAPALCFLAVGEAHLCEGRYVDAVGPLEDALSRLDSVPASARLKWDVLMSLALLDHRFCRFKQMTSRLHLAKEIAETHAASDAAAAATLVLASTARVRSEDPKPWFEEVLYSAGDAMGPTSRWSRRRHILDRLLSVGKARSYADLSKLLGDQASGCGRDRDLVGYLVLVSIAAATEDAAGRRAGAESLLQNVAKRLASQQQEEACGVLQTHIDALRGC